MIARKTATTTRSHDDGPVALWKRVNAGFDQGVQLAGQGLPLRIRQRGPLAIDQRIGTARDGGGLRGFAAGPCRCVVHDDPSQPRGESRAPRELVQVEVRIHVTLLDRVLCKPGISQDTARRTIQALVVSPHDDLEQRVVAAKYALDDLLISQVRRWNGGTSVWLRHQPLQRQQSDARTKTFPLSPFLPRDTLCQVRSPRDPNLQPIADLLGVDQATVRAVLNSWGPGKFDAELSLDGKAFRPGGRSAATLLPPAFGLAGVNLHTWTGWGGVTHWNAFVANLEMHGQGTFFDARLDDALQFPVAAKTGLGNLRSSVDLITSKLAALQFYPTRDSRASTSVELIQSRSRQSRKGCVQ